MDSFLQNALIAGLMISCLTGPLGCLIIWRRMAFFGDTLSHNALLGVALGVAVGSNLNLSVLLVCFAIAGLLTWMETRKDLASDTSLGILSHSGFAAALVALSLLSDNRIDLNGYLFGDILATGPDDLWFIGIITVGGLIILLLTWPALINQTIHTDLARAEAQHRLFPQLAFLLLSAATVALAMKIIGILLVSALLIIPAATARRWSKSPEQMAVIAVISGMAAVGLGIFGSLYSDAPTGPAIVLAAVTLFIISRITPAR